MLDEFNETGEPREAGGKGGLSDDAFLGGKLQMLQPEKGYRAGIDAAHAEFWDTDALRDRGCPTCFAAAAKPH